MKIGANFRAGLGLDLKKENHFPKKTFPYEFQIDLETRVQGHVVARCVALPGCQAQGRNAKEALDNLKNAMDLYFSTAFPAYFETIEKFNGIPIFYSMTEYKGRLFASTGRDKVFVSNSGVPGSWKSHLVTKTDTKFFTPEADHSEIGDYSTQIYCLSAYSAPGKEKVLFAGTNLNGSIYYTTDGENWRESFATGEDRIHVLCEFKNRLYAGTSSQGKIYAYDGLHWSAVGNLSEAAVTALGVFKNKLYVGTYPSGLIFCTDDGLNWEEVASTSQSFIQCLKEFNGALYAGTSGSKGVKIYRTINGKDWITVYDSGRELNCYCMEVFENTLFVGTGNSGRVLKTHDGVDWTTAYAGDVEGIRAFVIFNDYLYAGSENQASILRSTYDMAHLPVISDLKLERVTSQSMLLSWMTDIAATSEVHYGEKSQALLNQMVQDKDQTLKHRMFLTGLKAQTEYEIKVISAHRLSSLAVSETLGVQTPAVIPPTLSSPTHPQQDKWEKLDEVEILLNPGTHLRGYYYCFDQKPDTVPVPPEAAFTDSNRIVFQGVLQGSWYAHVSSVDEAGNIGLEAAHYRVHVDTEALAPVKVFSSTHPDCDKWVPNPTPVIAWEAPPDFSGVAGYYVKADKVPDTVPGPSKGELIKENRITIGPFEDDLWYIHISTLDQVGNVGVRAAHYPIRVDTKAQAPSVDSATHPKDDQWYSNHKLEITLIPSQDLSGVDGYYYCLDQEAHSLPIPEEARWTQKNKITFENLSDGVWYFHVRTKDRAENLSSQATHFRVNIDTQAKAPVVSSHTHPDEMTWYRDRHVILNWEAPEEFSGVDGFYYNIDRKVGTKPDEKTGIFTTHRTLTFELTEDGLWYFHLTTRDKAGNLSSQAGHYTMRVDTQVSKPSIDSPTHPDEKEWYSKTKAVFRFASAEDLSGVAGYYYTFSDDPRIRPASEGSSYSEKTEVTLEIPHDGVHYLSVLCVDKAGNLSEEPVVYQVQLDTHVEAPELTSATHPEQNLWYANRRVEITWKDPPDLSGIEGYYTVINREENWMPVLREMAWTTAKNALFNLPEDGIWYAHICAKDKAQNIGALAHYKIMSDSNAVAPIVKSLTHPVYRWVQSSAPKLTWEVPQDMAGIDGYYVMIDDHPHTIPGPSNGEWVSRTFMTVPFLKDGKWFFHIAAKDKAGNVSKEATHYPLWIDTTAPKSTMVPVPVFADKTQLAINWDATDASGEVVSFDVQIKAGTHAAWSNWLIGVTHKTATYQGQDGLRYAFRCRAKDVAGNVEEYPENEMISFSIDISPPTPVTDLKAIPIAGGDIELKWLPAQDSVSGLDYYRVYRWVEGETPKIISTHGEVKEISFIDKGGSLKENTVYYYCVHPVDKMGNEQFEGNATAASLSDASVGTPVVSSPSHSSDDWSSNPLALLTWNPPADATGIVGYYYGMDLSSNTKLTGENGSFINKTRLELPRQESGVWYFHLIAKDRAGNISDQTAHYRLKIDVQKPEAPHVVSTSHPDTERWYSDIKVNFELNFAPKLSGLDCYYYIFDQKPETLPMPSSALKAIQSPVEVKASDPGVWYFHCIVRDKAGNLSKPRHVPVLIALGEMPPPVIASPTHPRRGEAVNHQSPVFTWEDRHDGSFHPKGYFYKLSKNEKEILTDQDLFTTERMVSLKDVEQGTWYFHVAAGSKKGKPGHLSSAYKIMIDRLGKVFGHFMRKDGKTPIVETKVEMAQGDKIIATCMTDIDGKFNFSSLKEGKYEIRLHSDQFPVLRVKDINVTAEEGVSDMTFTEDSGFLPSPPSPGPVRFYYFLKEDCNVTLEIFDSNGVLVVKQEEKREGGVYAVTIWDATGKPAGEYLYKLSAKSVLKNNMSRFSVKKFKLEKPAGQLEPVVSEALV